MSLLMQVFLDLKNERTQFVGVMVDMLNVRTLDDFLIKFGTSVIKHSASTPDDYASIVENYLDGTHFVFDRVQFINTGQILSLNWKPDENDIAELMMLPQKLALAKGMRYVVVLNEFQNLMNADEYETVFKIMETQMKERDRKAPYQAVFVMMGGMVNAMKLIFDEKPDADQRANLKAHGFRWAPSEGAWQRQLNSNAIYAASRIDFVQPEDGKSPTQIQPKMPQTQKKDEPVR